MTQKQLFGYWLQQQRIKNNMTQRQVSDALKYTKPQFVSNWERGICYPPIKEYKKIISVLKADASEFKRLFIQAQSEELVTRLEKALK